MDRNRGLTKSLWQWPRTFLTSNLPTWEDLEDGMNQWLGKDSGVTVSEDDKNVYIEAHVPGLKSDDINVSLDRNTLRITAERQDEEDDKDKKFYRRAQRSFFYQVELPTQVEENTEQAQYEDGVLHISFKKQIVKMSEKFLLEINLTHKLDPPLHHQALNKNSQILQQPVNKKINRHILLPIHNLI